MKIFVVVLMLLLCYDDGSGAFERSAVGARGAAMGGAVVAAAGNEWTAMVNPGALQTVGRRTLALFYAPQPFEMKELAFGAAVYVEPTSLGTFAIGASRFGFELYHETRCVLSYAGKVTAGVRLGVNLVYYALSIRNYGSASSFGIDLGVLVDVADGVRWGFSALNPNGAIIGAAREKLPQVFSTGVGWAPVSGVELLAGVAKDVRFPAEVHAGFEYTMFDVLAVRAGTTSEPGMLHAGVGVKAAFARFDYAFSSHSELGNTHQISVSLELGD